MELGKTIKKLRRERDMTQEALAEALSISPQAVSRWECGDGYPDISLIPTLCYLFDVSSDTLLGIDVEKKAEAIERISEEAMSHAQRGYTEKADEILQAGLREYPNSDRLICDRMDVTYWLTNAADAETAEHYRTESIALGEKLLETSTDDHIRHSAIQTLCFLYSRHGASEDPNDIEKARKLAVTMPYMAVSHECLTARIEKGTAKLRAIQAQNQNLGDFLGSDITWNVPLDDGNWAYTPDEMASLREKALTLLDLLYEDGNYGFYHCRLEALCLGQAKYCAEKQDAKTTLAYLERAASGALGFLAYAADEAFTYTSLAFRGMKCGTFTTGDSDNDAAQLLRELEDPVFDFIRDTPTYTAIIERLTPHAGKWQV